MCNEPKSFETEEADPKLTPDFPDQEKGQKELSLKK